MDCGSAPPIAFRPVSINSKARALHQAPALRAKSSEEILSMATRKGMGKSPFEPDTDGYFLPQSVAAIFAADTVLHTQGNYSRGSLAPYATAVRKRFGAPRQPTSADWLPANWLRFAAQRLMTNRAFTRNVVINRWFLHAHQPALRAV